MDQAVKEGSLCEAIAQQLKGWRKPPRKGDCQMTKLRQIVKDAFKCDELVYQFGEIDVEDGIIAGVDVMAEVNAEYHDDGIVAQAENRLDIAYDNIDSLTSFDGSTEYPDDMAVHKKEARQLERFLKKYRVA